MSMCHGPMNKALNLLGVGSPNDFTYQDYLYELLADGSNAKPVTEQQWETIVDIRGNRRLAYASNTSTGLRLAEARKEKSND